MSDYSDNGFGQGEINNTDGWKQGAINNTNGWGKARCNNTIGWGQAPLNNTNGWGQNIILPCGGLLEGWDFIVIDNDVSGDLYTANKVEFTATNLDYIQLRNTITLSGDFKVSFISSFFNLVRPIGSDNNNYFQFQTSGGDLQGLFKFDGVLYTVITNSSNGSSSGIYEYSLERQGTKLVFIVNGIVNELKGVGTEDFYIDQINGINYKDFSISYLNIDDQHEYLFTEGIGEVIKDKIGGNDGIFKTTNVDPLLIPSWELGVNTSFNDLTSASNLGYNIYDRFKGTNNILLNKTPISITQPYDVVITAEKSDLNTVCFYMELTNGSDVWFMGSNNGIIDFSEYNGSSYSSLSYDGSADPVGTFYKIEVTSDGNGNRTLFVNGNPSDGTTLSQARGGSLGCMIGSRMDNANKYRGVIYNLIVSGTEYNTFNNWDNGTKTGVFDTEISNETSVGSGVDDYGTPILGSNDYDTFDGLTNEIEIDSGSGIDIGTDLSGKTIELDFTYPGNTSQIIYNNSLASASRFSIRTDSTNRIMASVYNGSVYTGIYFPNTGLVAGDIIKCVINVTDYSTISGTFNGTTGLALSTGSAASTGNIIGSKGGSGFYSGIVSRLNVDGTDFNTFNSWNGGTKTGTFTETEVFENISGDNNDIYGMPIVSNVPANEITTNPLNTQTSLMNMNNYYWFNGVDNLIIGRTSTDLTNKTISGWFISPGPQTTHGTVFASGLSSTNRVWVGIRNNGRVVTTASNTGGSQNGLTDNIITDTGDLIVWSLQITDTPANNIFMINGVQAITPTAPAYTESYTNELIGSRKNTPATLFYGLIGEIIVDGVSLNPFNDWLGTKSGTFDKYVSPEDPNNLGYDLFDYPINRPKLIDGYNFSGQDNHRLNKNIIVERDNVLGDSDSFFLKLKIIDSDTELLYGDDKFSVSLDSSDTLEINYNGQIWNPISGSSVNSLTLDSGGFFPSAGAGGGTQFTLTQGVNFTSSGTGTGLIIKVTVTDVITSIDEIVNPGDGFNIADILTITLINGVTSIIDGFVSVTTIGSDIIITDDEWVHLTHVVSSTGERSLYLGSDTVTPILIGTASTTTSVVAATLQLKVGNTTDTDYSFDGYETQLIHYPFALSLEEIEGNWLELKKNLIFETFDYNIYLLDDNGSEMIDDDGNILIGLK